MEIPQETGVAILGGGKGGTALLDLFSRLPEVKIVGIADKDPSAPALRRALEINIPFTQDAVSLIAHEDVNLIVDVTGDPGIERLITEHRNPNAEVLGGATSKLLWNLVQHEAEMQSHLLPDRKIGVHRDLCVRRCP